MASVMRAMSASIGVGSGHRSSLSVERADYSGGEGDGLSLSLTRTNSRLVPPLTVGSPTGILINSANRPYANSSAASSVASLSPDHSNTDLQRYPSSPSVALPISSSSPTKRAAHSGPDDSDELERGRSSSRDSVSNNGRKIRFAPLPEIRQRSYSTGRNVWVEDGQEGGVEEGEEGVNGARIYIRRDGEEFGVYGRDQQEGAIEDSSDDDDEDGSPTRSSLGAGLFGSWKSDSSGFSRRYSASSGSGEKENDAGTSPSVTTKLLRPLSFGLGKKKKSGRPTTSDGLSSSLSRTESMESDVSRGSSTTSKASLFVQQRPQGTGIPMRKTRTWELGDAPPPTPSRRAQYPPVAQRSRTKGAKTSMSTSAPDPSFKEWGFSGGTAAPKAAGTRGGRDEDEDDGSGMAWIRKRKAQREAEAAERKRKEEEAAAVAAAEPASGTATPRALSFSNLAAAQEDASAEADASHPPPPLVAAPSGLSSTRPEVILTAPPATPQLSGLSATRPPPLTLVPPAGIDASSTALEGAASDNSSSNSSSDSLVSPTSSNLTAEHQGLAADVDEDDDDSSEDEDDDEDDSDLDDEELAKEEELAEKARVTAAGAGAERYHDAKHQTRMLKVEGH